MAFTLQANKKTTISGDFAAGATSLTLATAAFTNFTNGYLVVDYDNDSKFKIIKCTVSGTSVTSITRGQDGTSDVAHSSGAKIGFMFVPSHYTNLGEVAASDAWTSWTPTFGGVTVGNGTLSAKYQKIGRNVRFRIDLTFGSTTSVGGAIVFSLPVAAGSHATQYYPLGIATAVDSGTGVAKGQVQFHSATQGAISYNANQTTDYLEWQQTAPFTWTTNDRLFVEGFYESAS